MTRQGTQSLATLVDLRERERDRLSAEMAEQQAVRARFQRSLERLDKLCAGGSGSTQPGGLMPLALSLNHAGYKQGVMALADTHRQDLALHEAEMLRTRQALAAATLRHQVLGQVLADRQSKAQVARDRQDQKRLDDMATQVWARGGVR